MSIANVNRTQQHVRLLFLRILLLVTLSFDKGLHSYCLLGHHRDYKAKSLPSSSSHYRMISSSSSLSLSPIYVNRLSKGRQSHYYQRTICRSSSSNKNSRNNDSENSNNDKEMIYQQAPSMSDQQRKQENEMEQLSYRGATKISELSISERTKRAMLAEVLEDHIFANVERMDTYYDDRTGLLYDENDRDTIRHMIEETQTYRKQYQELVTGESSTVLNSLEQQLSSLSYDSPNDNDSLL